MKNETITLQTKIRICIEVPVGEELRKGSCIRNWPSLQIYLSGARSRTSTVGKSEKANRESFMANDSLRKTRRKSVLHRRCSHGVNNLAGDGCQGGGCLNFILIE